MSSKYGVGYYRAIRAPAGESVGSRQRQAHFVGQPRRRTTPDHDIQSIRDRQARGDKKRDVLADYPNMSDSVFESIWRGYTAAYIVGRSDVLS